MELRDAAKLNPRQRTVARRDERGQPTARIRLLNLPNSSV
jgi:hypothetical protein